MSGLDKIKARIMEEAEQSAREIIEKAQAEAEAAVNAAEGGCACRGGEDPGKGSKGCGRSCETGRIVK